MTTTSSFLSEQNLGLEYRPGIFADYSKIAFIQLKLDAFVVNEELKTVTFHATGDVTCVGTAEDQKSRELRVSRYSSDENSCLVCRMHGLGRSFFFIVRNDDVNDVDARIQRLTENGTKIFAVQAKTFLLDSAGERTMFSHSADTAWPVDMAEFYWSDIPSSLGNGKT